MRRQDYLAAIERHFNPALVGINMQAIKQLQLSKDAAVLVGTGFPFTPVPLALEDGTPYPEAESVVHYLLALTSLQYRFWEMSAAGFRRYDFEGAVGSTGMSRAFDRAWGTQMRPGSAILAAADSVDDVLAVFGNIPDPQSRQRILQEVLSPRGEAVAKAVAGMVLAERKVTLAQADFVARALPGAYGDLFLKKAMLFLGLVASWGRESIPVEDELAAYADYQVPNVLRHHGVLQYGCEMRVAVENQALLEPGGERENAIRAATVLACEKIAEHAGVTSAEVDWWAFQQRKAPTTPFHLTETTNY